MCSSDLPSLDNWLALDGSDAFFDWLDAAPHAASAVGLLTRFARAIGLQHIGAGARHFLSAGSWHDPLRWQPPYTDAPTLLAGGIYHADGGRLDTFAPEHINEHVRHSWYRPYPGGRHPFQGETVPDYQPDTDRYTWAKAPRYGDKVVQTGPLAELRIAGDPLISDLLAREGDNTWLRQFARLRRTGLTLHFMKAHLAELGRQLGTPHFLPPPATPSSTAKATASCRPPAAPSATGCRSKTAASAATRSSPRPPGTPRGRGRRARSGRRTGSSASNPDARHARRRWHWSRPALG